MRLIVGLFILYFSIILFSFTLSLLLKKDFGKCIPLSFLIFYFIQHGAHLLGRLSYYKYLLLLFIVISIAILVLKKANIKTLFSFNSFYIFSLVFIYLFVLTRTKGFTCIDDFWDWGIRVKECIRIDSLYDISANAVFPPDTYHPFCTVLEIFFCKILGKYSEQACLFSISLFSFSFLFGIFGNKLKNNIIALLYGAITFLTISLSSMFSMSFLLNSIYVDWPLSIVFAYCTYCVYDFDFKSSSYIYLSAMLIIMLLIKQIAFVLFIGIIIYCLIIHIYNKKTNKNILYLMLPIVFFLIWRLNATWSIQQSGLHPVTSKSFLDVFKALSEKGISDYWIQIWNLFINSCLTEGISGNIISIPYVFVVLIIFTALLVLSIIKKNNKIKFLSFVYLFGSIAYMLFIYVSYCTIFIEYEAVRMAEFARYMQTYVFAGFIIIYYIVATNCKELEIILFMFGTCLFVEPKSINTIIPTSNTKYYKNVNQDEVYEYVTTYIGDKKVLCISVNDIVEENFIKYMFAEKMNSLVIFNDNLMNENITFNDLLNEFRYIYVGIFDNDFKETYWDKVTDTEIYNESLYSIQKADDGSTIITLERIFGY